MASPEDPGELDPRDLLEVLKRRRGTILLTLVVVVGVVVCLSLLQSPVYRAEARVILEARASDEVLSPRQVDQLTDRQRVLTEIEVITSRSVHDAAAAAFGREIDISAGSVGETSVVAIRAEDRDPEVAARAADTYTDTYLAGRRRQLIDELLSAAEQVQAKVAEIQAELGELDRPLDALDDQIAATTGPAARAALEADRVELERQLDSRRQSLTTQESFYAQQLDELQLAGNLSQGGGPRVLSRAEVPEEPVRPAPVRDGLLALAAGLVLGLGFAFLSDFLDDTVRSKDDLERVTGGLPVLGLVPAVADWRRREETHLVSVTDPESPSAEAYRSLRTSMQFLALERPTGLVQFTSPNPSEGKTTTLANLAVALAGADQKVAIVCCDLRRPRVHEFFGVSNSLGLTSVLLGTSNVATALQSVGVKDRVLLLPSGPMPPNPSELLSSAAVAKILAEVKELVDIVLVDSPPLLPVTDGLVIAGLVDTTLLVVRAGRTTRKASRRAVELLRQIGAPLVGTVLNGVETQQTYGYDSGYGRYQAVDRAARSRPRAGRRNGRVAGPDRTVSRERSRPRP